VAKTNIQDDDDILPSDEFTNLDGERNSVVEEDDDYDDEEPGLEADAPSGKRIRDEDLDFVDEDEEDEEPADVYQDAPVAEASPQPDPAMRAIYERDVEIIRQRAATLQSQETFVRSQKDQTVKTIEAAKKALKAAMEEGDTDAEIEANETILNARQVYNTAIQAEHEVENYKRNLRSEAQNLLARKDQSFAPAQKKNDGSSLFPKWRTKNAWFDDTKHSPQRVALIGLDAALSAEGKLDMNTPEYFSELGRRFNRVYPGMYKDSDGRQIATGKRKRGRGPSVPSGGSAPRARSTNKIRLTSDDKDIMEKFGMDPDDESHRRRWLAEKRSQAANIQARG